MSNRKRAGSLAGASIPRADALSKACGTERFAADLLPEGCLWAGAKRAGVPHARILSVDTAAAKAVPGVVAVLTGADVPGTNRQGIVHKDMPVICRTTVRHCGDAVALVVAGDKEALARALALIEPVYEILPAVLDPEAAMAPDAPLVHDGREQGNLLLAAEVAKGDAPAALPGCDVVVTGSFATPIQEHAFLEPPSGVARVRRDGSLEMIVSSQAPFRDRFEIAAALSLNPLAMRIKAPYLGGGFGGKDGATVQCLLALAALHAGGRWVKMAWSREETAIAGYKRHAATLEYTLGATQGGELVALDCRVDYDCGAYAHLGAEIMALGMEHAGGPYRISHTRILGRCVYTNTPVGGAFRGFGVIQTAFAMERMMDRLAAKLGIDRLELRRKNALRPGDANCSGVGSRGPDGVGRCLDLISRHPLWTGREAWKSAAPPHTRRGVGLACGFNAMGYGRGLPDSAIAKIELAKDGGFVIYNAVADMGQGNASAFVQIAAEALSQEPSAIRLVNPDTARCHPSGSSSASRTTYTFGNALLKACAAMRAKIKARAALFLMRDEYSGIDLAPGKAVDTPSGREVPLARIAAMLPRDDRVCLAEFVMPVAEPRPDTGHAFIIGFPHLIYSHAAHLCGVEVDELTGQTRLVTSVTAVEGGKVLNPQGFTQQIEGASAQGAGFALTEDFSMRGGRCLANNFSTYLIPTAMDLPDLESLIVPGDEKTGPYGLKGIGEVGIHGPSPALAGAIEDACGVRLDKLPLSPEAVLAAMGKETPG